MKIKKNGAILKLQIKRKEIMKMIPELENVLAVFKTVIDSIRAFFEQLLAIIKGDKEDVPEK